MKRYDAIREVIADELGLGIEDLKPDTRIKYDLNIDTTRLWALPFRLHKDFGVLPPFGSGGVRAYTVKEFIAQVEKQIGPEPDTRDIREGVYLIKFSMGVHPFTK